MFKSSLSLCLCAVVCAAFVATAAGQTNDRQVVEKLTAKQVQGVLNEMGFPGSTVDDDGDVLVNIQGFRVMVIVGTYKDQSLQMIFAATGSKANLRIVNDWNREQRFSSAFIDDDGDAVLQSDLDLEGGVTIARVKDFIKTYSLSLTAFTKAIS